MPTFCDPTTGKKYRVGLLDAVFTSGKNGNKTLVRTRPAIRTHSSSSSKKTEIEKVELDKDREENSAKAKTTRSTVKEAKAEEIPAFKNAGTGPTDTVNASPKKAEMSGTFPVDDWTDELDEKLVKLKEDGKSWPDIVSSLGKPKKQVTKRYGELMREKKNRNKKKYGGSSSRVKDEESESKAKRKAEEGEEFPSMIDFTVGTDPGDDIKLFTSGEPFQEVDGQDLSAQDTLYICRIHDYLDDQKWVAISSAFYTETGKRISPEILRDTFVEGNKLVR